MRYLKIFEKFDESLIEEISEFDYFSWQKRAIGQPTQKDLLIIRDQISKIEPLYFKIESKDKAKEKFWSKAYEYSRSPSFINNETIDIMIRISLCDDEWYVIQLYSTWRSYYFLCDTSDGLNQLSDVIIQKLSHH